MQHGCATMGLDATLKFHSPTDENALTLEFAKQACKAAKSDNREELGDGKRSTRTSQLPGLMVWFG